MTFYFGLIGQALFFLFLFKLLCRLGAVSGRYNCSDKSVT